MRMIMGDSGWDQEVGVAKDNGRGGAQGAWLEKEGSWQNMFISWLQATV